MQANNRNPQFNITEMFWEWKNFFAHINVPAAV